ncbi:hypothetical protein PCE1_000395 [Barthelona sp. PCE]
MDPQANVDPRVLWIERQLRTTLRLTPDAFRRMMNEQAYAVNVKNFLESKAVRYLITCLTKRDGLITYETFPKKISAKLVVFLKHDNVDEVPEMDIGDSILVQDISADLFGMLASSTTNLFGEVFETEDKISPLFDKWPKVLVHDLGSHFQRFKNDVKVIKGSYEGETVLPLPSTEIFEKYKKLKIESDQHLTAPLQTQILEIVHYLEGLVGEFQNIIISILSVDIDVAVLSDPNSTPLAEIKFFKQRLLDFKRLETQINSDCITQLIDILNENSSSYVEILDTVLSQVKEQIAYLESLSQIFEIVEPFLDDYVASLDGDIEAPIILSLWHCLFLAWKHSVPFRDCLHRIVTLIVRSLTTTLSLRIKDAQVFSSSTTEILDNCLKVGKFFLEQYQYHSDRLVNPPAPAEGEEAEEASDPWTISAAILYPLEQLMEELGQVHDVLDKLKAYDSLQTLEIGGDHGEEFNSQIQDLAKMFNSYKEKWQASEVFSLELYKEFTGALEQINIALSTIFERAVSSCASIESYFSVVSSMSPFLKESKPLKVAYENSSSKIIGQFERVVSNLSSCFLKYSMNPPTFSGLPSVANSLTWSQNVQQQSAQLDKYLEQLPESEHRQAVIDSIKRLDGQIASFQKTHFDKWISNVETIKSGNSDERLLVFAPKECKITELNYPEFAVSTEISNLSKGVEVFDADEPTMKVELLQVNFNTALIDLVKDVRYVKNIFDVPTSGLTVFEQHSSIRSVLIDLQDIMKLYNAIYYKNMNESIKELFSPMLESLHSNLEASMQGLTWGVLTGGESPQLTSSRQNISDLKKICSELYELLTKFNDNQDKLFEVLDTWTKRHYLTKIEDHLSTHLKFTSEISIITYLDKLKESNLSQLTAEFETVKHMMEKNRELIQELYKSHSYPNCDVSVDKYLEHMNDTIGCFLAKLNLNSYLKLLSITETSEPVLHIFLSLNTETSEPSFFPGLDKAEKEKISVHSLFERHFTLFDDILKNVSTVTFDNTSETSFFDMNTELFSTSAAFSTLRNRVFDNVEKFTEELNDLCKRFMRYQFFWSVPAEDFVNGFLTDYDLPFDVVEFKTLKKKGFKAINFPEFVGTLEKENSPIEKFEKLMKDLKVRLQRVSKQKESIGIQWGKVSVSEIKSSVLESLDSYQTRIVGFLSDALTFTIKEVEDFVSTGKNAFSRVKSIYEAKEDFKKREEKLLEMPDDIRRPQLAQLESEREEKLREDTYENLVDTLKLLKSVSTRKDALSAIFSPLGLLSTLLSRFDTDAGESELSEDYLTSMKSQWSSLVSSCSLIDEMLLEDKSQQVTRIKNREVDFAESFERYRVLFRNEGPVEYYNPCSEKITDPFECYEKLNAFCSELKVLEEELCELRREQDIFDINLTDTKRVKVLRSDLTSLKKLWDINFLINTEVNSWISTSWRAVNTEEMELKVKSFLKLLRKLPKECRQFSLYTGLDNDIKTFISSLPLISDLKQDSMRQRHWKQIVQVTGVSFSISDEFTLRDMLSLNLGKYSEEVEEIVVRSKKELQMESNLSSMKENWTKLAWYFVPFDPKEPPKLDNAVEHKKLDADTRYLLMVDEEFVEALETDQLNIQNMLASKYCHHFLDLIKEWQVKLSKVDGVMQLLLEVQKTWKYLVNIFQDSEDIRNQLPDDSERFDVIHEKFLKVLTIAVKFPIIMEACNQPGQLEELEFISSELARCQKALDDYLELKRKAFPRFYFISAADLLDILSKAKDPLNLQNHLSKLFSNVAKLRFEEVDGKFTNTALGMISGEGEQVDFAEPFVIEGAVEDYLNDLVSVMQRTIRSVLNEAVNSYDAGHRERWIKKYPAQIVLTGSQIWWTTDVSYAFEKLLEGKETALSDYNEVQHKQIMDLITTIQGDLVKNDRRKVMTLCTLEVHSRDVVAGLIRKKVDFVDAFEWQSQLRTRWDDKEKDCFVHNMDAVFRYSHEYLGNRMRLVITPLTDRCYITLCQALYLHMGGSPAGPAGTGKTETVKDLSACLARLCIVSNCSDQMSYITIGNLFKGLVQSGAWGCFDEFNRIAVEVLSVVATQVKSITDALKSNSPEFFLLDDTIKLNSNVGLFITMNPGYAGRTELPENLKALFRPVSMVVPDYELIAEIMLMAEGFYEARVLAKKFTTLYGLCKDLLSKQDHYDWGLRAIKSVLVVAGGLRRSEPKLPEEHVLMRALRDFNLPKIVTEDTQVFMGLINDLFPSINIPRKVDRDFEKIVTSTINNNGLQSDSEMFVLKIIQLKELLEVRHSVFIIGPSGSGKTETWRMLARSEEVAQNCKVYTPDLNPKAQPGQELFGFVNPATRDWRDGLFSKIMRDLSRMEGDDPKWIILDGDIDTGWIESLNTVQDDNKVLTLASNERVPLTPSMRLIFEISHLKYATPATVSRAGILFINATDIGYMPYVRTWIESRPNSEHGQLLVLFEKYVPACLRAIKKECKTMVPFTDFQFVQNLCSILSVLMSIEESPIFIVHPHMVETNVDDEEGKKKNGDRYSIDLFNDFMKCKENYINSINNPEDEEVEDLKSTIKFMQTKTTNLFKRGVPTDFIEYIFVFGCIWVFGAVLKEDQLFDYQDVFSKWFKGEYRNIRIPADKSIYDVCLTLQYKEEPFEGLVVEEKRELKEFFNNSEHYTLSWVDWEKIFILERSKDLMTDLFEYNLGHPEYLAELSVETPHSFKYSYFIDHLIKIKKPVLLVGGAGTGKTALIKSVLKDLDEDEFFTNTMQFNYYTTAEALQNYLEANIERKAGRNFAPPGLKKSIYFIDDLNMPEVDAYGTQSPSTLLRQHLDYGHWYDRQKRELMNIGKIQYIAAMNPSNGSFNINDRLQRHFAVFAFHTPDTKVLDFIFNTKISSHLVNIDEDLIKLAQPVVSTLLNVHRVVSSTFLPTAIKFHYHFNLRELSRICTGLFNIGKNHVGKTTPFNQSFLRCFVNEMHRVYGDRLCDQPDSDKFNEIIERVISDTFTPKFIVEQLGDSTLTSNKIAEGPFLFSHYTLGAEKLYYEYEGETSEERYDKLKNHLNEHLEGYRDQYTEMPLVFFVDAMNHVLRIARILEQPGGHVLLIGVGGSGKQSLSRLAAYISGFDIVQITVTSNYNVDSFKQDLQQLFLRCGLKDQQTLLLLTDQQIKEEAFLISISDFLATGDIPGLFIDDTEIESIIDAQRNEVKMAGLRDTKENCWANFIAKVNKNFRFVLSMSPVGSTLRNRVRMFPTLMNCVQIDWYHAWPYDALVSVAKRNLIDSELDLAFHNDDVEDDVPLDEEIAELPQEDRNEILIDRVVEFMAHAHCSANDVASDYLKSNKRNVYTTPKSFLELIELYKSMLQTKRKDYQANIERLENGLIKLNRTAEDVEGLKEDLEKKKVVVAEKEAAAQELLKQVARETEIVDKQKAVAEVEAGECALVETNVSEKQRQCDLDLQKALPAIAAAEAALDTLNKDNLVELRSMGSPPELVEKVMQAVFILLSPKSGIPRDLSWKTVKAFMGPVMKFLDSLKNYDKENIPQDRYTVIKQRYLSDPNFIADVVRRSSVAAAGICDWVCNIIAFYDIHCDVEPKRLALAEATEQLEAARSKLQKTNDHVQRLTNKLGNLKRKFEEATKAKQDVIDEARSTEARLNLANRLVNGLGGEKVRWAQGIGELKKQENTLIGDIILSSAFVSYLGPFNRYYRDHLIQEKWLPKLKQLKIPISASGENPLNMMTNDATIAKWNNQGLPNDSVSIENAAIISNCARWPLIIDPQLQGISWLRNLYGAEAEERPVFALQMTDRKYMDTVERAISEGQTIIVENVKETIDVLLDPIINRNIAKKGRSLYIKLGDKEVDFDSKYRMVLQSKMPNPHYQPETQAQTTLINFTTTPEGLEEQLLAFVVKKEKPELEELKSELMRKQNEFKITIKSLEDKLLYLLSSSSGDILSNTELIESLEMCKKTSAEIEVNLEEAKRTEIEINKTRNLYRPVAQRASLIYFIMLELANVNPMYMFSLQAFINEFDKAIDRAIASEDIDERIKNLLNSITYNVFIYVTRGLFERHKLVFASQLCFAISLHDKSISVKELNALLGIGAIASKEDPSCPISWLDNVNWLNCIVLSRLLPEAFARLPTDLEASSKRWKDWFQQQFPEKARIPGDYNNLSDFQKLLLLKALRPDRLIYSLHAYVDANLGNEYVELIPFKLEDIFQEASELIPILFVLSPGTNPLKDVEALYHKLQGESMVSISLGQGQTPIAEEALLKHRKSGGWVILENLHLTIKWLPWLEKFIEGLSDPEEEDPHPEFRLFLTSEPTSTGPPIPQAILETSIKVTNEPPSGVKANLYRALKAFDMEAFESCSNKTSEFKSITFALCVFHSLIIERKKFGAMGWNAKYPFNLGDLTICASVLKNFLEDNVHIPWANIKYIFGEIMYGGHISDDWDRRLCNTYLQRIMKPQLFEGMEICANYPSAPVGGNYDNYYEYVQELPEESPELFGLHSNAEIEYLNRQAGNLLDTLLDLQPKSGGGGAADDGETQTPEEIVMEMLQNFNSSLPEGFEEENVEESLPKERSPYVSIWYQEMLRMQHLVKVMKVSLNEVEKALNGELTITSRIEAIIDSLYFNKVPTEWVKVSYPSLRNLADWFVDLMKRINFLKAWEAELGSTPAIPKSVWLSGLFNPQSFLTAVMQVASRKNQWPLDKMVLVTDVVKKNADDISAPPREGAYIVGLYCEGARWDKAAGVITDAKIKELYPEMPVIHVRAQLREKVDTTGMYQCPVYVTRHRGGNFVWEFFLKTRSPPQRWILAGVALLLQAN